MRLALFATLAGASLLAGCGSGSDDARNVDPFTPVQQKAAEHENKRHAAPRWERIAAFSGDGPARKSFNVDKKAIQWRIRWRCDSGAFRLSMTPRPREGARLETPKCRDSGRASSIETGTQRLDVRASGPWEIVVEQQVDTRIAEPPLRAMTSRDAKVIARGKFYRVERKAAGAASLYRLPTGRLALRFDGFETEVNTDLYVWLSRAKKPTTSRAAVKSPYVQIAALKSTWGDQNYLVPRRVKANAIRSIVIWCEPVNIAYVAAALKPS